MGREKRLPLIADLEDQLGCSLICYVNGDRENLNTRVAPDISRIIYRHLESRGFQDKIGLFLYTRGGDVLTPWRLVNLIKEYCHSFITLVPFRAYSAGTLICLGAREIIMGKMGELSPIDPTVANAFNPRDPDLQEARIPVSVEDVSSFLNLARDKAGLGEKEEMAQVFLQLSRKVHPLALGNVHRNYSLIRSLGKKLLEIHDRDPFKEGFEEIINNLTEKLYAHNYMIPRVEARDLIKLPVTFPPPGIEENMWALYENYEEDLQMLEPFNPANLLKEHEHQVCFQATGGIIESLHKLDAFIFEGRVTRQARPKPDLPPVSLELLQQNWRQIV